MGGWKKEGVGKPHKEHPSQKGVLDPPSYGTFSTPLGCQYSVFPVQKSTTEQTKSSFGWVQKFSGERVLWYVFLPPYVLHPPISQPNFLDFLAFFSFPTFLFLCVSHFLQREKPKTLAFWGVCFFQKSIAKGWRVRTLSVPEQKKRFQRFKISGSSSVPGPS